MLDEHAGDFAINPTNGMPSPWTETRIERLKILWDEGGTAESIAKVLGGGLTKSSVIAKARRLELAPRQVGFKEADRGNEDRRLTQFFRNVGTRKTGVVAEQTPRPPGFLGVALLDLERNMCRFPRGNGPFVFCGQPVERGSYCGHCYRIVYQPAKPRAHQAAA